MKRLNKTAGELAVKFGVRAATDITGFSLLGHAWEMAQTSAVGMQFLFNKIPFTRGARRYAADFIFPGGSTDNRLYYGEHVDFDPEIGEAEQLLLFDAQTSGGLLMAVPGDQWPSMQARAAELGQLLWPVGKVLGGNRIRVSKG
jgi:selenide,water dikinase